jgi:glycosyltransferase involved in cell wall biosynthesis
MKLIGTHFDTLSTSIGLLVDPPSDYREKIENIRAAEDYDLAFTTETPLITIRISTYKGLETLKSRCIPAVLAQTYTNYEVIVVGDNDPEPSRAYIEGLMDSRFKYIQREFRGPYPDDPRLTWLISGAHCFNVATAEAKGMWLTKLDQDDSWEPTHLESLLDAAQKSRAEIVYGKCKVVFNDPGIPRPAMLVGEYPPKKGSFALTTSLIHGKFKEFKMNELSYLWGEPGDWGLSWRLWLGGAKFEYTDQTVANIFYTQKKNDDYYQSQYKILLDALALETGTKNNSNRPLIKAKLFINRLKRFVKSKV